MAQRNKIAITEDNMAEWLASTGFLFPRNEIELARFDKLYSEQIESAKDFVVDCRSILSGSLTTKVIPLQKEAEEHDIVPLKMVARKGSELPAHIIAKIKKNQDERTKDDSGTPEKGAE